MSYVNYLNEIRKLVPAGCDVKYQQIVVESLILTKQFVKNCFIQNMFYAHKQTENTIYDMKV